jgi:hypothetical protein
MSAERQWMVCALAAMALSAAADADAQKQTPHASGHPGKGVPFAGFPGSAPPAHEKGLGVGPGMLGMSGAASGRHAGGRDESDAPGESLPARPGNSEHAPGRQRRLHEIPTCD